MILNNSFLSLLTWVIFGFAFVIFAFTGNLIALIISIINLVTIIRVYLIGQRGIKLPTEYEEYQLLAKYLSKKQWKKADKETTRLLFGDEGSDLCLALSSNLPTEFTISEMYQIPMKIIFRYCESIPCKKLQNIDQLWSAFSQDKFGLLSQMKTAYGDNVNDFDSLGDRLGWKTNNRWIYPEDFNFRINAPVGHLPAGCFFSLDLYFIGFIKNDREFAQRTIEIMFASFVWEALISRCKTCLEGEPDRISPEQRLQESIERLETYLSRGQWYEADQETFNIINQTTGRDDLDYFDLECFESLPCQYLQLIDQLWVEHSAGKFGISIQKQIWQECGSPTTYNDNWKLFKERVGWLVNREMIVYCQIDFTTSAPRGHLPCWAGWTLLNDRMGIIVGSVGKYSSVFIAAENCQL
jgi:hypothetical protein